MLVATKTKVPRICPYCAKDFLMDKSFLYRPTKNPNCCSISCSRRLIFKIHGKSPLKDRRNNSEEEMSEMVALYQGGISCPKIAKRYNVSIQTVMNILYEREVEIRNKIECRRKYFLTKKLFNY